MQHFSLRTKIVVPMVGLAVLPVLATGIFTITWTRASLHDSEIQRVEFDTDSKASTVEEYLHTVRQDLRFLARTQFVRNLASPPTDRPHASTHQLRRAVEREFLIFSQGKRAYNQIRYLNQWGQEVVRIDVEGGTPEIVPPDQLQDKSDRYYVKAALALETGQIYVSPMDLNIEHGKAERPYRGVVRYATPVLGNDGSRQGFLIVNLHADYLRSLIGPLSPGTDGWLVNNEGKYLGYIGESKEREQFYSLDKDRTLEADDPEVVSGILENRQQVQTLEGQRDILSFARIPLKDPGKESVVTESEQWTLLLSHPRAPIDAPIEQLTVFLSIVTAVVAAIAGGLGLLVAHYLTRPVAILRRATREIAADLTKRVHIQTGDEIEQLANDFNLMTQRLREAQDRLAAWNAELEHEVARKTGELHQLQGGLARAEKLASIGQMTASVMHEIGNPLAAIKTQIQVTEEDEDLCNSSRAVFSDIVSEVDRLTVFLRSCSRLYRLREPRMEDVSPDSVVQGVITLITPELRRRGVVLQVHSAPETPTIHGDPDQLRQLLINLLLNAAEASKDGGTIVVKVGRRNTTSDSAIVVASAEIEVSDEGEGMSPQIVSKIWAPFFTTKDEGTGLGLAICRQIVEDHAGTIRIASQLGEGTVVTILLPERKPPRSQDSHADLGEEPLESHPSA